jgi:heme/copper-type cytochrome/quinol oxidase subunit 3
MFFNIYIYVHIIHGLDGVGSPWTCLEILLYKHVLRLVSKFTLSSLSFASIFYLLPSTHVDVPFGELLPSFCIASSFSL